MCRKFEVDRHKIQRELQRGHRLKRRDGTSEVKLQRSAAKGAGAIYDFGQAQSLFPDAIASLSDLDPSATKDLQRRWVKKQRAVKSKVLFKLSEWFQPQIILSVAETRLPFSGKIIIPRSAQIDAARRSSCPRSNAGRTSG